MITFRYILSFHEPRLATHLHDMGLGPELYAISWFMTLYAHIFPLDKVYMLWDHIMIYGRYFFMFVGVSILKQFQDTLLSLDFNHASEGICIMYDLIIVGHDVILRITQY